MTTRQANEMLEDELKSAARKAERLVQSTAEQAGETVRVARNRLGGVMDSARATYGRLQDKTITAGKATDRLIRGRPYETIGIALGVGLVIGLLMRRR